MMCYTTWMLGMGGGRRMIGELEPGLWGSPGVVVMR